MNSWEVREKFICGKAQSAEACEDLLVETARFTGVIDSSSGIAADAGEGGSTLGRLIGLELLRVFESAEPTWSVHEVVRAATERVSMLKRARGCGSRHTGGCFFCAVDRANDEVWRLGDCWYTVDGRASKPTLAMETPLSELRSAYLWARRLAGESDEQLMRDQPERTLVMEYLKVKDFYANTTQSDRGYGVINGDTVPEVFIERVALPKTTRRISMGTDGYPVSGDRLDDVEASLAQVLRSDPLMIEKSRAPKGLTPGSRSYDDRAFISVERSDSRTR